MDLQCITRYSISNGPFSIDKYTIYIPHVNKFKLFTWIVTLMSFLINRKRKLMQNRIILTSDRYTDIHCQIYGLLTYFILLRNLNVSCHIVCFSTLHVTMLVSIREQVGRHYGRMVREVLWTNREAETRPRSLRVREQPIRTPRTIDGLIDQLSQKKRGN